jgi:hypothetical protein
MKYPRMWLYLVCAAARSASAAGQDVPNLRLSVPDAELAQAMVTVMGVRELPDGRVLVVDSRRNVVLVADLRSGSVRTVGRIGLGDLEYCHPTHLIPLPGDSSLLFDDARRRLLTISPAGEPTGVLDPAVSAPDVRASLIRRIGFGRADQAGNLYVSGVEYRR